METLTAAFERATAEKLRFQEEVNRTNKTIELANRLVKGLEVSKASAAAESEGAALVPAAVATLEAAAPLPAAALAAEVAAEVVPAAAEVALAAVSEALAAVAVIAVDFVDTDLISFSS